MQCCKSITIIIIQNAFKCNLKQLTEQQRAPSVLVLSDWSICQWLIFFNIIHVIPWHEELPLCSILCQTVSFSQFPPPPPFFFYWYFFDCDRCLFLLLQVLMVGLGGCASDGGIIQSRGWLPKVELLQAPNLHLVMQLLRFK